MAGFTSSSTSSTVSFNAYHTGRHSAGLVSLLLTTLAANNITDMSPKQRFLNSLTHTALTQWTGFNSSLSMLLLLTYMQMDQVISSLTKAVQH